MNRPTDISRRRLLKSATAGVFCAALNALLPVPLWAVSNRPGISSFAHPGRYDLKIGATQITVDGEPAHAIGINGTVPGPLLRFKEGEPITLNVGNALAEDTSIHWHGLLLPTNMDGVPGLSYPGIKPGETYRFHYHVKQSGTYWYHSHSGLQEQVGVYGPIVIDPADADPVEYDSEFVVFLSDWTFEEPERIFANLKRMDGYYNYQKRTVFDFFEDVQTRGWKATMADRRMWGRMRMAPSDIADVTGATYTYLMNGLGPDSNWTGLFAPGERVRLRFINGSAMSFFNVRIPGLEMTVVQADGQNLSPVVIDEFQIGTAETYDVVVTPASRPGIYHFCRSRGSQRICPGHTGTARRHDRRGARVARTTAEHDEGYGDGSRRAAGKRPPGESWRYAPLWSVDGCHPQSQTWPRGG